MIWLIWGLPKFEAISGILENQVSEFENWKLRIWTCEML